MAQAQVNALARTVAESETAVHNLLLSEGILPPPASTASAKKRKRPTPAMTEPSRNPYLLTKRMRKARNAIISPENISFFASQYTSIEPITNDMNTTLFSQRLLPSSSAQLTLPSGELNTLSQILDFDVSDLPSISQVSQPPQINSSTNSSTGDMSNKTKISGHALTSFIQPNLQNDSDISISPNPQMCPIQNSSDVLSLSGCPLSGSAVPSNSLNLHTDLSQIIQIFSNFFDIYVVPSLALSYSGSRNVFSHKLRVYLLRELLFNDFSKGLSEELISTSTSSPMSIDNLISRFLGSCAKLGLSF